MVEQSPESSKSQIVAMSAADIDLVEVAKRVGGNLEFQRDGNPQVTLPGYEDPSLKWCQQWDWDKGKYSAERELYLWRGSYGGGGMEICGAVLGPDYVTLIHPYDEKQPDLITAEILSRKGHHRIQAPRGVFHPSFLEAQAIANRNYANKMIEYLSKHKL